MPCRAACVLYARWTPYNGVMQLGSRQGLREAGLAPTALAGRVRPAVQWPQRDVGCSSQDL
eukprot:2815484-Lingulodinium_polyedra.AAC.1